LPARQNPSRDPPRAPDFERAIRRFPSRDPPQFRSRDPARSADFARAIHQFRSRNLARAPDFARAICRFPSRDPPISPISPRAIRRFRRCVPPLSRASPRIYPQQPTIILRLADDNTAARLRNSAQRKNPSTSRERAAAIARAGDSATKSGDLAAARRRGRGDAGSSPRRKRDGAAVTPYRITMRRPCCAAGDESGRGAPGRPFGGRGGEAGAHGRDQRAAHA